MRLAVSVLKQSCEEVTLSDVNISIFYEELFALSNQTMLAFALASFDSKAVAAVRACKKIWQSESAFSQQNLLREGD